MRNQGIDLIRGVSILLVLFHHFNIAYTLNDTALAHIFGPDVIRALARNGNYGVTMFFVVSGYLITSNADQRWAGLGNIDVRTFYRLRAARILPCLLLLVGTVDVLALAHVGMFQNHVTGNAAPSLWIVSLASLTFWMNVLISHEGWINYPLGVLWSLSVEEVFYATFPLLCLLLRHPGGLLAFWAAIIVAGPFYRQAHQGDEGGFLFAYFASFDGIAVGCCTALLANRLRTLATPLTLVIAMGGMALVYLWGPIAKTNVLGVTAMALGTAVLLISMHNRPTSPTTRPINRAAMPIAWLGRHSYELYLFHLVILAALRQTFPQRGTLADGKLLLLMVFFILSIALSAIIARFYAEPLNRRIRKGYAVRALATTSGSCAMTRK